MDEIQERTVDLGYPEASGARRCKVKLNEGGASREYQRHRVREF